MKYTRFAQLWDALIADRPNAVPITSFGTNSNTAKALIEYANGDKRKIESVRSFIRSNA